MHFDLPRSEHLGGRNQVRPRGSRLNPEGDDVRMFEKQEEIRDTPGTLIFDQRFLHVGRRRVRNDAKSPYLQLTHFYMVAWGS
jgi:hypothetical protein